MELYYKMNILAQKFQEFNTRLSALESVIETKTSDTDFTLEMNQLKNEVNKHKSELVDSRKMIENVVFAKMDATLKRFKKEHDELKKQILLIQEQINPTPVEDV